MRNLKRIMCLFLVVALCAMILVACQGGVSKKTDADNTAATGSPTKESKPVLKYLGRDATFDLASSPIIPIIEEFTGYKDEYEALPAGEEGTTKLMMLISSGTSYDIINSNTNHFDRLLAAKALLPVDDMIKNAPNLLKCVPLDSTSWLRVKAEDGKAYGIPQLHPVDRPVNTIAVRQDILNELGINMPDTPEEFYDALKTIQEKKPEMIPYSTEPTFSSPPLESGFNVYKDWYEEGGKLIPNQLRSEYKEYITFMRQLYAEGLMDQEFPANDAATRLQKFTSGKAAMIFFGCWEGPGFYSALQENIPSAEVSYVPFLKDKNGNRGAMATGGLEKVCMIPKTAAHPEDAIAWIDAFIANFKDIYIGPEGEHHKVENGKYVPIMPAFSVHDTVWWFMPAVDEANVFDWWQARVRKNAEVERAYMDTFALRHEGVNAVIPTFAMYPPNEEFIELGNILGQYWKDEMVKIVTGAISLEEYDKIVEKWKADGGTRYVELANQIWEKYK